MKYNDRQRGTAANQADLMLVFRSESAVFGDSDGPWASERHDPGLLQVGKAAQITSWHLSAIAGLTESSKPPSFRHPTAPKD
jgi:hypothetical protein